MAAVLKYSVSVYEGKINQLESLAGELQQHLNNLEEKRNQLRNFWNDVQGERYFNLISDKIDKVQDALDQVNRLKYTYNEIIGGLTASSSMIDGIIEDVTFSVKSAISFGGGGAAK